MVVPTVITKLQALKQSLGFRHIYEVWSRNEYWRFQAQARGGDDREMVINTAKGSTTSACIPKARFCCCISELQS